MMRAMPRPADQDAGTLDSAKCPRGCGAELTFRSNSLRGGITEQCCYRCRTPWTVVPRRRLVEPVAGDLAERGDGAIARRVLAALPTSIDEAVFSKPFCERFGPQCATARRVLNQLRRDGTIESERRHEGMLVWRAA